MEYHISQVVLGVIAAIVAIFGLSFTVFWSIIRNVETRLTEKIDSFGNIISKCQNGRTIISKDNEIKFSKVFAELSKKSNIETAEQIYVRKREHELEFALLKEKMDSMQLSIKELKSAIENGSKK